MRNAGNTIRRQESGWPHSARTDDNVYFVNELILSQEGAPKNHKATRQISLETGIHHSSVYCIVRQNLKLKCLKKRRAQELTVANCALRQTRAWKLLRRFPASAVDFIFFMDRLVWKLVDDIFNTWSDRLLLCFAFISSWVTTFSVGFCCVMFMSTVAVLGVFSACVTIKYHASI